MGNSLGTRLAIIVISSMKLGYFSFLNFLLGMAGYLYNHGTTTLTSCVIAGIIHR